MNLFNKESFDGEESKTAFEQYRLYVEMADRVSERRGQANTFFTSVNTLLFAASAFFGSNDVVGTVFIGAMGCVISLAWYFTLNSYRQLNSGKFTAIGEIEKRLPLSVYAYEWTILGSDKNKNKYWPLSHVEKIVPAIFFIAYVCLTVSRLCS